MLTIEPGTTPEITVEMPVEADAVEALFVTFVDKDKKMTLEKSLQQVTYTDKQLRIELTQEETLGFPEESAGEWQIRFRMRGEKSQSTIIMPYRVGRVLKKGVI